MGYDKLVNHMIEQDMDLNQFIWASALEKEDLNIKSDEIEFYQARLDDAIAHYKFLDSMTLTDRIAYITKLNNEKLTIYRERALEERRNIAKCTDMLAKVQKWEPPTTSHEPLKNFMITELDQRIGSGLSYYQYQIDEIEKFSLIEMFDRELISASVCISCAEENLAKAKERADQRKVWIDALIESVGLPYDAIK